MYNKRRKTYRETHDTAIKKARKDVKEGRFFEITYSKDTNFSDLDYLMEKSNKIEDHVRNF